MSRTLKCPRCGTMQQVQQNCEQCGLDFKLYAEQLRQRKAQASPEGDPEPKPRRDVTCPECKTTQPLQRYCENCGFDFKKYAEEIRARREAAAARAADEESDFGKTDAAPLNTLGLKPTQEAMSEVGVLMSRTWAIYKKRALTLLGLYFASLAMFVSMIILFLGVSFGISIATPDNYDPLVYVVGMSIGALGGVYLLCAGMGGMIAATCNESLDFKSAFAIGREKAWSYSWLMGMVPYVVFGGFLLFFIPGLIWGVSFFAAQYILFHEGDKGLGAMVRSTRYVKGHWWDVFIRLLIIMVLSVVVGVVPVIGPILFTPFMFIFMAEMYFDLRQVKGTPTDHITTGAKFKLFALATLGYIIAAAVVFAIAGALVWSAFKDMDLKNPSFDFKHMAPMSPEEREAPADEGGGEEVSGQPMLSIEREEYAPGEMVVVRFTTPTNYPPKAWVGIVPSDVPHGNEEENDRNKIEFKYLKRLTGGNLTFTAPAKPGSYDLRMHDAEGGGREVAYVTFRVVEGGAPSHAQTGRASLGTASLGTTKTQFAVDEPVDLEYKGFPGNEQDWITIVPVKMPDNTYGEYFYTRGKANGRYTFKGLPAGEYEARAYFNWPHGGYTVKVRQRITVGQGFQREQPGHAAPTGDVSSAQVPLNGREAVRAYIFIYSMNYVGHVSCNDSPVYEIKGERNMQYNYNGYVTLRPGRNVLEVDYEALPDPMNPQINIKVSDMDTRAAIGEWRISGQKGSRTIEITAK